MNNYMNFMKPVLAFCFLSSIPLSVLHAAEPNTTKQLSVQKSTALPAHLTTRIQWNKFPKPQYKNEDLKEQNRAAIVRIVTDEEGQISKATVQESTGLTQLDQLLVNAVMQAEVKPYLQDGIALPIVGYQTFSLNLQNEGNAALPAVCNAPFMSRNWQAQQDGKKRTFVYLTQPQNVQIQRSLLEKKPRLVKFSFKVNDQGYIRKVKLDKRSGDVQLDQQIIQSLQQQQVQVARKFWIYRPSTLKDQITLSLKNCQAEK